MCLDYRMPPPPHTHTPSLRTVSGIDASCSTANDKLRRLTVVLPDVASIAPLDYDTSKRADPEVLQKLVQHAKTLRVSQ